MAGVIVWILGLWKKKRKIRESHFFFIFFGGKVIKSPSQLLLNPPFLLGVCLPIDLESLLLFHYQIALVRISIFFFKD